MKLLTYDAIIVAKGFVVLSKSVTPARISANIAGALAAYKAITKDEVATLDKVAADGKQKRYVEIRSWVFSRRSWSLCVL